MILPAEEQEILRGIYVARFTERVLESSLSYGCRIGCFPSHSRMGR
jgi:hypothetical protein